MDHMLRTIARRYANGLSKREKKKIPIFYVSTVMMASGDFILRAKK